MVGGSLLDRFPSLARAGRRLAPAVQGAGHHLVHHAPHLLHRGADGPLYVAEAAERLAVQQGQQEGGGPGASALKQLT